MVRAEESYPLLAFFGLEPARVRQAVMDRISGSREAPPRTLDSVVLDYFKENSPKAAIRWDYVVSCVLDAIRCSGYEIVPSAPAQTEEAG